MAHNPGDQICGRFELVRVEPEGTGSPLFGQAWAALDSESGELVRLAIIEPALLADEAARDALIARLRPLSEGGQEDSLVPLSYIGRDGEHVVAAFEALYAGISLADVLADLDAEDRLPELGRVITDVALGLALLHGRGVLHGALGIETIFVWERGNALWQHGLVESCDPAAIAARIAEAGLAVAPEVAETGQVSAASDVFAWGATIAAYISGKSGAEAVEALRAGELLSESGKLLELLQAAVDPSPAKRPRSGGEVVKGLRDAGLLVVAGEEEGIDDEVLMALAEAGLETISVEAFPPEVDAPPPSAKAAPKSEAKAPEAKAPEAKTPEAKTPEAKAPEAKTPEVKAPEVKGPEAKAPEVKAPEAKAPEVKAPPGPSPRTPPPVVPPAIAHTPAPSVGPPSLGSRGTSKPPSIPAPPKFELPKPRSRPHSSSAGAAKLPKLPSLPSLPTLGGKPVSAPGIPPLPTAGHTKLEVPPLPEVAPPLP
ncbi:MAG: protein kinase, partial [Myxococcales bacterium]|nr:protein kinase [Myxococcales bacterium]